MGFVFIADLGKDLYWSSMTSRLTNGERSSDVQVFHIYHFCMVGIWHIPTLHNHDIFPPGGNMTGGNVQSVIVIIIVIVRVQEPHCSKLSLQPWLKVFVGPGEPFHHHQHHLAIFTIKIFIIITISLVTIKVSIIFFIITIKIFIIIINFYMNCRKIYIDMQLFHVDLMMMMMVITMMDDDDDEDIIHIVM